MKDEKHTHTQQWSESLATRNCQTEVVRQLKRHVVDFRVGRTDAVTFAEACPSSPRQQALLKRLRFSGHASCREDAVRVGHAANHDFN